MPWALQGSTPAGTGLEIGAGSGLMAAAMLDAFPALDLTVTDYDSEMLEPGRRRLAHFGERVSVQVADATSLAFPDETFDNVFSFIMLHHVVEWEKALAEVTRVLKPGGWFVGYDILDTPLFRVLHRVERADVRPMSVGEMLNVAEGLPLDRMVVRESRGRSLARFKMRKGA
jgi:ubiquinone/menaquinone biosynthesis C-methylase UbiE